MKRYQVILLAVAAAAAFAGTIVLLLQPGKRPGLDPDNPTHLPQLVGVPAERLGDWVGELYTGFDVYTDTPGFSAGAAATRSASGHGARMTRAEVREALCELVAIFHRNARFQPGAPARKLRAWKKEEVPVEWAFVVAGYADLRALSGAQAAMLAASLPAVAQAVGAPAPSGENRDAADEFRRIREVMSAGAPCRVALGTAPGGGEPSFALVYKVTDYELASVLWVYDPDFVYGRDERTALRTLVMYDRIEKRFLFFLDGYRRSGPVAVRE